MAYDADAVARWAERPAPHPGDPVAMLGELHAVGAMLARLSGRLSALAAELATTYAEDGR